LSTPSFRYPSSRWLLRQLLRAYGYGRFPTLRTSERVYKDGGRARRTPHSDRAFLADALDLLSTPTPEDARERMYARRAEETVPWLHSKLLEYDRLAAELNAEAPLAAGGRMAAIPAIRVLMYRITTPLAALAAEPGMLRPGELVWAAQPGTFNTYMDQLIRAACPGESLEACYDAISEAARHHRPDGKGISRKTMVRWRSDPPGDRFRFGSLLPGVHAAAELAGLHPTQEVLRARWLAATERLLGRLGSWLGTDTLGEPLLDDIRESFGVVTLGSAETFASPILAVREVADLLNNPLYRSGGLRGAEVVETVHRFAESEGVDPLAGPDSLAPLLLRLQHEKGLAIRLTEELRRTSLRGDAPHTVLRALHPSLAEADQEGHIRVDLLLDDHIAAYADTAEHLSWWHRRLHHLDQLGHPGHLVAEFLVATGEAASRRWEAVRAAMEREGPEGPLSVGFEQALAELRRHQAEQLVGGGVPLELAKQRLGLLGELLSGDASFEGRLRALEAIRYGRTGEALQERLAAFRAAPSSRERAAELAQALAGTLEDLGRKMAREGAVSEGVSKMMEPTIGLLLLLGVGRGDDRRFLKYWASGLFAVGLALRQVTSSEDPLPVELLSGVVEELAGWEAEIPENGIAHALLADGYDLLGDRDRAIEHAKEAAKLGYPGYWARLRR
jgi:hypothetical protein